MVDMSVHVAPKSDQLNADDLIAGPMVVTITGVSGTGASDQPIAVSFEGDGGKPYKPCKSMRRVMLTVWGRNGDSYVGKRMRLFRDPKVVFGGIETGGIRISHMSGITSRQTMALTATRASRKPYSVDPLEDAPRPSGGDKAVVVADGLVERVKAAADIEALQQITGDAKVVEQRAWLRAKRPELADRVDAAVAVALAGFAPADEPPTDDDDTFPGDR
jgi:hypothetical protein